MNTRHAQIGAQPLAGIFAGHLTHEQVANKVRMLFRDDLDHEAVCMMARDRIVWLAARVAEADELIAAVRAMRDLFDGPACTRQEEIDATRRVRAALDNIGGGK